jgi:DNA-binding beta-propeller fold protein YncE
MTRLVFLLLAFCFLAPCTHAKGLAVVLNSADASISLIDIARQTELRREPVLREPHHLALTPDGRALLVGDTAGNEFLFLDPVTGAIQRRMTVSDPYQLGFSPDGRWLTVTGLARNEIDIYDAESFKLAKRLPAATMPSHLAYAPDGSMVYITLQGTNRLVAINLKSLAPAWNVEIGPTPAGVIWNRDKLLVGIMGNDYVAVIDPVDGHVERRIITGRGAHNLFFSPDRSVIYVANRVDGSISALDPVSLAVLRTYKVPGGPDCMAFPGDGKLWVTQRFAEKVGVLDLASGELHSIAVGRSPHGIFLNVAAP